MVDSTEHKFIKAEKIINSQEKQKLFQNGNTYKTLVKAIDVFQDSIMSKQNLIDLTDVNKLSQDLGGNESNIFIMFDFLHKAEELTKTNPALNKDKQRFGNTAFRNWYEGLEKLFDEHLSEKLNKNKTQNNTENKSDEVPIQLSEEIKPYILECFGNGKRIDFGTGHELNFFCVLLILTEIKWFPADSMQQLIQILFKKYISVCRHLQQTYNLEPAGSKGVYGLDDYHFLSFIFGAAELVNNNEEISPLAIQGDIRSVGELAKRFMFFDSVNYNVNSKNGQLAMHSPVLFQISNVPKWEKIAKGLIKMYEDEVLRKLVVMQHFYFGSILKFE
jgi:serine/threonine-protein phosphatase 2A activator